MRFDGDADCFDADYWHVEPHILVRLGDFDHDGIPASQSAASLDGFIRSLETLYRQDRSVFHDNGLPDIEPADFPGDLETQSDIVFFTPGQFPPGDQAGRRQTIFQERSR